jgi:hypothetical protein
MALASESHRRSRASDDESHPIGEARSTVLRGIGVRVASPITRIRRSVASDRRGEIDGFEWYWRLDGRLYLIVYIFLKFLDDLKTPIVFLYRYIYSIILMILKFEKMIWVYREII